MMIASRRPLAFVARAPFLVSAFALLVLLAWPQAEAGLVVSNLANSAGGGWTIGSSAADLTDSPVANRFTTGSGPGWLLDSVVLNLGVFSGTPTGNITVYLALDNAGAPGSSLTGFPATAPTAAVELVTLNPQVSTMLAANTSYWLVVSANVNDQYVWNFTNNVNQTGLPGWLIGDTAYGGYPSGSWTPLILPPGATPAPTLFQVNATAVPEPSTLVMSGTGVVLVGLGAARRRRLATA